MSDHPVEPSGNVRYVSRFDPHYFPDFDPPHPSPSFNQVMYDVSGQTRNENHLITLARDTFLSCCLTDPQMIARLDGWTASIGLPEITNDVANFLDQVATRYGFARRAEIGRTPRPPHTPIEDLLPEWHRLQDRLYAKYRRSGEVLDLACAYVRAELQQPWPWLAYRLALHIYEQAWERALGITVVRQRTSHLDPMWEPFVQHSRITLETKPYETLPEAKHRLDREYADFIKNLQGTERPKVLPKGYPRKDQQKNVIQDARWLYRQLLCSNVPYQMAMAWHHERQMSGQHAQDFSDGCGCQRRVYDGLKKVKELLNASPFVF
jgi:hypothetical protein